MTNTPQVGDLVLTVRMPWAWLILNADKDIENRTWPTKVRGRVWIHAAKGMTVDEYWDACRFVQDIYDASKLGHISIPDGAHLQRGGIIGSVDIVDCVSSSESPWFCGPWGFVLKNPTPCDFIPCRGALGFWRWSPNALALSTPGGDAWIPVTQQAPPREVPLETKIDDGRGVRNQTTLTLHGTLWFLPDMNMYVYYRPTHWRHLPEALPSATGQENKS